MSREKLQKSFDFSCSTCAKNFQILGKEYRRQSKIGRTKFFCSLSCSAVEKNKNYPSKGGTLAHLTMMTEKAKQKNKKYNEFSYYIRKAIDRSKRETKKEWGTPNLDREYLESLWIASQGKCCFTDLPITLWTGGKTDIFTQASLDRIDSSKGYVKGNVQFCIAALNYAKSSATDEQFRNFIARLKE